MNTSGINSNFPMTTKDLSSNLNKIKDDEFQRKLEAAKSSKNDEELKKVSKDLESIFVNMMFKEMRKTVGSSDLVQSAPGKGMYEDMFDEKISDSISKGKGIGLADMIYKQLSKDLKNDIK